MDCGADSFLLLNTLIVYAKTVNLYTVFGL